MNENRRKMDISHALEEHCNKAAVDDSFRRGLQDSTRQVVAGYAPGSRRRRVRTGLVGAVGLVTLALLVLYAGHVRLPFTGRHREAIRPITDVPASRLLAVTSIRGSVTGSAGRALRLGDRVAAGSVIRTGKDGRVTLVTHNGTLLHLASNSDLSLDEHGNASVPKGRLYCSNRNHDVRLIETPAGRIRLLGTVLDAAVLRKDAVAVTVVQGKVELINSLGKSFVQAGRRSVLMASATPESGIPVNTVAETAWYDGRDSVVSGSGVIAYVVDRPGKLAWMHEVWAMNSDGSGKHLVKTYVGAFVRMGPWWPGTDWVQVNAICLVSAQAAMVTKADAGGRSVNSHREAWLLNTRTGEDTKLDLPPGFDVRQSSLSPDGRLLALAGVRDRMTDRLQVGLWVYDLQTGQVEKLLDRHIQSGPAWSPDGRIAVSVSTGPDVPMLKIADPRSGRVQELGIMGVSPSFSPDGRRLAYCGDFKGYRGGGFSAGTQVDGSVFVLDLASGHRVRITRERQGGFGISWSPDGTRLLFSTIAFAKDPVRGKNWHEVLIGRADGSGTVKVYEGTDSPEGLAWRDDSKSIYLRTYNGSNVSLQGGKEEYRVETSVRLYSADGSGPIADLGGTAADSPLSPEVREQMEGAADIEQEARKRYSAGLGQLERDQIAGGRENLALVRDLYAEMAWRYPLANLSTSMLAANADTADATAAATDAQLLDRCCEWRLWILQQKLQWLPNDLDQDAKGVWKDRPWVKWPHSLDELRDWLGRQIVGPDINDDGEAVRGSKGPLLYRCPGRRVEKPVPYEIILPADGKPKVGDVLLRCPNHRDHKVVWDQGMLRALAYFR